MNLAYMHYLLLAMPMLLNDTSVRGNIVDLLFQGGISIIKMVLFSLRFRIGKSTILLPRHIRAIPLLD
jgi:hypothetical protein